MSTLSQRDSILTLQHNPCDPIFTDFHKLFPRHSLPRTIWSVNRLVKTPGSDLLAEMSQMDGLGRVSVKVDDLITEILFKKINSAVV